MLTTFDANHGVMYVKVRSGARIAETIEAGALLLDVDEVGGLVGVERLTNRGLPGKLIREALGLASVSEDDAEALVKILGQPAMSAIVQVA